MQYLRAVCLGFVTSLLVAAAVPAAHAQTREVSLLEGASPDSRLANHETAADDVALYLVPRDFASPAVLDVVHDYGTAYLAAIGNLAAVPVGEWNRITPLRDRSTVSYHAWRGPAAIKDVGKGSGYYILTLMGPFDERWTRTIEAAGFEIVGMAHPYALVVSGDAKGLAALETLKTSAGRPVVRGYFPVPPEAALHPDLELVSKGRKSFGEIRGLRRSADGRAAVRVLPYRGVDRGRFLAAVGRIAPPAGAIGRGYPDAVLATPGALAILSKVEGVDFIDVVLEPSLFNNLAPKDGSSAAGNPPSMNVTPVWALGWNGAGISVNHNDSGVNPHADFPNYNGVAIPPAGSVITRTSGAMTGTDNGHGTHTAGSVIGRGLAAASPSNTSGCGDMTAALLTVRGTGHGATMTVNNIFDGGITTEAGMMQWGYQMGSRLSTNSWGYSGSTIYGTQTIAIDTAVRDSDSSVAGNQQFFILFAAGNDGSGTNTVSQPGLGKNSFTVGASQNDRCGSYVPTYQAGPSINTIVNFSSRGPSVGRIKPDVVAPGSDVLSVQSSDGAATHPWDEAWTGPYYEIDSGTSMSTPLTAGAAATWFQFYQTTYGSLPSPALAKAAFINGAVDTGLGYLSNTPVGTAAQNSQGWGRVNLLRSVQGPPGVPAGAGIRFVDQGDVTPLTTGATWSRVFDVGSNTVPLKVTMVWTDPPGAASCNPCDVNDLNLVVTSPGGTVYRGNQFTSNWSTPNPGATTDQNNNVENVFVQAPQIGVWTIQVASAQTAQDPPNMTGQDFAVVYSGYLCAPPSAPLDVTATPGQNNVEVGWTTNGSTSYLILRSTTTGGPYTQIGSVPAPPFLDPNVSGGVTYYYVVRAVTSTCASGNSIEASATPTGYCDLPPTFSGITSVAGTAGSTCELTLTWSAATSPCGGGVSYSVYRGTTSGFVPSSANRIAAGIGGLTYTDRSDVVGGTKYYYIVRALSAVTQAEDANVVEMGASAYGPLAFGTKYFDDLDGTRPPNAASYWIATTNGTGTLETSLSTCNAASPTHAYRFGPGACNASYGRNQDNLLFLGGDGTIPSINGFVIPVGSTQVKLRFSHAYDFENLYDGARLYYSTNDASYVQVPTGFSATNPYIESGGYTGNLNNGTGAPAWTGLRLASGFTSVVVNLDAVVGQTVWFLWRFTTDNTVFEKGYYVDDVRIDGNFPGACAVLAGPASHVTAKASSDGAGIGYVKLEWNAAPSSNVEIRYATSGFPTSTTGTPIFTGSTDSGGYGAHTHGSLLADGTAYYYSLFVKTGSAYSAARTVRAVPVNSTTAKKWTYHTSATALSPVAISGAVFVPGNDRRIHAMKLTAAGGDWPRTSPWNWKPLVMNAPAQGRLPVGLMNGERVILVGSQDGYVYCLNALDGSQRWATKYTGVEMVQAPPTAAMAAATGLGVDLIIYGTRNSSGANKIVALNASNGAFVWQFDNGGVADSTKALGIISGSPVVDAANKKIWFASRKRAGGSAYTVWGLSFDATSATALWWADAGDVDSTPVLRDTALIVGSNSGHVRAYPKTNSGEILVPTWSFPTSDGAIRTTLTLDFSNPWVFFSTSSKVWALPVTPTSYGTAQSIAVPSPTRPVLVSGALYVGGGDGSVRAITGWTTGALAASEIPIDAGAVLGNPVIDFPNGLLHVGTDRGSVFAYALP